MSVRVAIAGIAGRMGGALARAILVHPDFELVGATERDGPAIGADAALVAGLAAQCGARVSARAADAAKDADVWIDFTTPDATIAALRDLGGARAAVIGTTGLTAVHKAAIAEAGKNKPIVCSGNYSIGVAALAGLARLAAQKLGPDWDIEIIEAHHRGKVDAPSGTALMLGEAAAAGRNVALKDKALPARDGITGPRPDGGIGFAVVRGGGIIGEHEVLFASERETLRLSHHAMDRSLFADGALRAALWAVHKPPGLYDMNDVLGFTALG